MVSCEEFLHFEGETRENARTSGEASRIFFYVRPRVTYTISPNGELARKQPRWQ